MRMQWFCRLCASEMYKTVGVKTAAEYKWQESILLDMQRRDFLQDDEKDDL